MAKVSAWLRALKDHGKARPIETDEIAFLMEDLLQESDRAAVILLGTVVEDALEYELIRRMPGVHNSPVAYEGVFGFNSPCGSFSSKITIAHALGVLSSEARTKADIIREIRNTCAHSRYPTSFATPAVAGAVEKLIQGMAYESDHEAGPRDLFMMQVMLLIQYIMDGKWRTSADDLYELAGIHREKA